MACPQVAVLDRLHYISVNVTLSLHPSHSYDVYSYVHLIGNYSHNNHIIVIITKVGTRKIAVHVYCS